MMAMESVLLLCVVVFVAGFALGQFTADLRRARGDAERIMRTRSNYRRNKSNQR